MGHEYCVCDHRHATISNSSIQFVPCLNADCDCTEFICAGCYEKEIKEENKIESELE